MNRFLLSLRRVTIVIEFEVFWFEVVQIHVVQEIFEVEPFFLKLIEKLLSMRARLCASASPYVELNLFPVFPV